MTPVWGLDNAVIQLVSDLTGEPADFGRCKGLAVLRNDGVLAAGLIFHNWRPKQGTIEVSAAAIDPRWATRGVLRKALEYAYDDCSCQMVVAKTSESNIRTRRLWKALGATEIILPRMGGRGASEAALFLTDDAWGKSSFMRNRQVYHRQRQSPSAP